MKGKLIIISIVLASVICSCQKNSGYTPSRQEKLENYAYRLFYDRVATPAITADMAYEFQYFLNLSDEERRFHRFANMAVQYDLDKYALLLPGGYSSLIIDTNGQDICTPGARWALYLDTKALYDYLMIKPTYVSSESVLRVECTETGCWQISENESSVVLGEAVLDEDNILERVWIIHADGKETDVRATGIESRYLTCDVSQAEYGFKVSLQKKSELQTRESYSFDGSFLVEIFSFGQARERAFILGKPGFLLNCFTEIIK